MRVGLFIPCYVDQFYPKVGLATVEVLRRFDVTVDYPRDQTCCGQPMFNTGCVDEAKPLARHFVDVFAEYEYVVCPSGSCVAMVRHHYGGLIGEEGLGGIRVFELCEFLWDVLGIDRVEGRFPHRVGLHQSCHGLRGLQLGTASELVGTRENKVAGLLQSIEGLEVAELNRPDECCGFGGTFAVEEEAISCAMGLDRLEDHSQAKVEVMTSVDMSCLMHLSGLAQRRGDAVRFLHVAEVLAESLPGRVAP